MADKSMPDVAYLRECFHYDPDTGVLRWRHRPNVAAWRNGKLAGKAATRLREGYLMVCLDGRAYGVHRVAWKMMKGRDPSDLIDHINGDRSDNRWNNLRAATNQENQWNKSTTKKTSGLPKGVYFRAGRRLPYSAAIVLGSFSTIEEASAARDEAAQRLHGIFYRGK